LISAPNALGETFAYLAAPLTQASIRRNAAGGSDPGTDFRSCNATALAL
jgi:hypothetical protein